MIEAQFILFVGDQQRSATFYAKVLDLPTRIEVPGMTQFALPGGGLLGLMPAEGIRRLLGAALPDPRRAAGVPRAELYLVVDSPDAFLQRALESGATPLSPVKSRDWGDAAGYCLDPDGHVLAFARPLESS